MPHALLVDATDLDRWAASRDAQARLPELILRLPHAAPDGLVRAQFRSGEGVHLSGWDGIVDRSTAIPFVPSGTPGWEVTTRRDVRTKANDDFAARTASPGALEPPKSTFIFAAARRFPGKETWARAKRDTSDWRDVRALDADDLTAWLQQAHAVHVWISRELGKLPGGVRPLEEAGNQWSQGCSPPLTPSLTIGGRTEAATEVESWLRASPGVHALRADGPDEALAFVAAVAESLPSDARLAVLDNGTSA